MKNSKSRRQKWMLIFALLVLCLAALRVKRYLDMRYALLNPSIITLPEAIRVLPGFKVSLLHTAAESEGSWISMAFDPQGRLIVSPQEEGCLLRLTIGHRKVAKIERIPQFVGSAMGLLYTSESLFLDCNGPNGAGIYRMRDNGGEYAEPQLVCPLKFSDFEHGAHGMALGPDGKLYVVCGDHTQLPPGISPASPFQNYAEDQLLPQEPDPTGWDISVWVPEGFGLRMDLDGKNRQLLAGGARNDYALAFNADGALFSFDNDHNFDIGTSWYRPCRINHWIPGADFGHRQGTGKFPEYYEDTLPATLNVGRAVPTAVIFAPPNCAFPPPYRDACFMADWGWGRIFAVHFIPRGATYEATIETILRGAPLNISAMEFGPDGALYFITGGRGAQSGLYRVNWNGSPPPTLRKTPRQLAAEKEAAQSRHLRQQLESFQGRRNPASLDIIWPALNSEDRWIRYAARVALEFQDRTLWQDRALNDTNVYGGLTALLALARCGSTSTQIQLFAALEKFPFSRLTEEQQLLKLRVMELSCIRQGHPADALAAGILQNLYPLYPAVSDNVNHELCQLLLYLDAPQAIAKTLALLDKAPTQEEQTYYVMRLHDITKGWTLAERQHYLAWFLKDRKHLTHDPAVLQYFADIGENYSDGICCKPFLDNFWKEAAATMADSERKALTAWLPRDSAVIMPMPSAKSVKEWRMADLLPDLSKVDKGRHIARGRNLFLQAQCFQCHHFGNIGFPYGPDLTDVGSRMSAHDILESIIDPSKVVAQQYQNSLLTLQNGDALLGRVVGEDDKNLFVITDRINLTRRYVPKAEVVSRRVSKISPMPEGLANSMTEDEIWDLVACLKAGFKRAPAVAKQ